MTKQLPPGHWFGLGNVPSDADDSDIQTMLYSKGIQVELDRISIRSEIGHRTSALVSLSREEVLRIFGHRPRLEVSISLEQLLRGAQMADDLGNMRTIRFFDKRNGVGTV